MHMRLLLAPLLAIMILLAFAPAAFSQDADEDGTNLLAKPEPLFLLQPLDDATEQLEASTDIQIFFQYFNLGWPYILGIAAGIAVLQVLVSGVQIMVSKGQAGFESGKTRLQWAIVGLMMIILAGFILRTLNPMFYK